MSQVIRMGEIFHQNDYDNTEDLSIAVAEAALVIPVTHAHVAKTLGAGAEELTLANGKPGQVLVVSLAVAGGGAGTLTPATSTGWTNLTLLGALDQAVLFYVDDAAGWRIWSLTGTDGPPAHT